MIESLVLILASVPFVLILLKIINQNRKTQRNKKIDAKRRKTFKVIQGKKIS